MSAVEIFLLKALGGVLGVTMIVLGAWLKSLHKAQGVLFATQADHEERIRTLERISIQTDGTLAFKAITQGKK